MKRVLIANLLFVVILAQESKPTYIDGKNHCIKSDNKPIGKEGFIFIDDIQEIETCKFNCGEDCSGIAFYDKNESGKRCKHFIERDIVISQTPDEHDKSTCHVKEMKKAEEPQTNEGSKRYYTQKYTSSRGRCKQVFKKDGKLVQNRKVIGCGIGVPQNQLGDAETCKTSTNLKKYDFVVSDVFKDGDKAISARDKLDAETYFNNIQTRFGVKDFVNYPLSYKICHWMCNIDSNCAAFEQSAE